MNRNKYFKYLRFDRLFTVVKLKQPSILWLAFLVSWFDNNSIYMWVVPCSPPKPRVLICCARPSHLKHWNSWKASAGPALHLAASPTSVCTSARAVLSLPLSATASSGPCHRSHEVHGPLHFIGLGQQCQVSAVRPRTPLKCPRQRQTLHRAGAVTTIAFLQGPFCPSRETLCPPAATLLWAPVLCLPFPFLSGRWLLPGTSGSDFVYLVRL